MKIPTFKNGKTNGYVVPIWNALQEPGLRPDQVYLTAVAPYSSKGPHMHKKRRGMFCCIKGNVRIVQRDASGKYHQHTSGDKESYRLVLVLPGNPACIYNDGDEEALVINMPSPAWSADDPDEWPVEDWDWK